MRIARLSLAVVLIACSGPTGAPGATGQKGDNGDDGQNGEDGQDGAPGPAGPQGPAGEQGPAGASGGAADGQDDPLAGAAGETNVDAPALGTFAWVDANDKVVEGMLPEGIEPYGHAAYIDPNTGYIWAVKPHSAEVGWWPSFVQTFNLARLYTSNDCSGAPRVWANLDGAPSNMAVGIFGIPGKFVLPNQLTPSSAAYCSHSNSTIGSECTPHAPCVTGGDTIAASDLVSVDFPHLDVIPPMRLKYFPPN